MGCLEVKFHTRRQAAGSLRLRRGPDGNSSYAHAESGGYLLAGAAMPKRAARFSRIMSSLGASE